MVVVALRPVVIDWTAHLLLGCCSARGCGGADGGRD